MKELTKIQSYIFSLGAIMMVAGVGCVVFGFMTQLFSVIFAVGSITFALLQMSQTYSGTDFTISRLRTLMVIGDLCFIFSALMMLEHVYHFLFPYIATSIDGYNTYVHYVHNNWVILLLIGAVFELYTTHRITYELNKQARKQQENL